MNTPQAQPRPHKVAVIGVGPGGLADLSARRIAQILAADLLIASERHLEEFADFAGDTLVITGNVKEVAARCAAEVSKKDVVVLGSGDPNFFGIGRYLATKLGPEALDLYPAPSSMQEAFARAGIAWHDAVFASCHGRPVESVVAQVRDNQKVGLFTDPQNTPGKIARHLLDAGLPDLTCWVCADLGMESEQVTSGRLSEIAGQTFPALNVLILTHDAPPVRPLQIGLPEEAFAHRKPKIGLITKREVRAVALSKLHLTDRSTVWDIGAGSGSVAIECALYARNGQIFAIEKNADDVENVIKNIATFGTSNLTAIHAKAPEGLADLPDPDAVFIGGTGGNMEALLNTCLNRLTPGGKLVMTLVTLENLATAHAFFKARELPLEVTQMNVSRGAPILSMTRMEAMNPVTILALEKPGGGG